MSAATIIAVFDIGKTNVKLVVLDASGQTLWQKRQANAVLPGPPYPHADVEALWAFLLAALREAEGQFAITHIVTTTHGATGALIDGADLVLPVLDYEYAAPHTDAVGYDVARPNFADTLSPNSPGGLNWGRQIFWQSRRYPEAFARAKWILAYPQYWSWRLSGVVASEVTSLGCHTDLWQPLQHDYSALVMQEGWRSLFPPLKPAYAALGTIKPELAAQTGLAPSCQIISGIHDSNASLVPHLVTRAAPFTVISTGTWVILMGVGAQASALNERQDMLANVDVRGDATICARFMGGRDYEALVPRDAHLAETADIAAVIAAGVFACPSFSGPCGPFPGADGRIIGTLPPRTGAASALAALYLALMSDACLEMIGARGDLIIEGSFAANRAYAGVLAALRPQQQVLVSHDSTGTSAGAALLASWSQVHRAPAMQTVAALPLVDLPRYKADWMTHIKSAGGQGHTSA